MEHARWRRYRGGPGGAIAAGGALGQHVDEGPQPRRHVAMAGVVKEQTRDGRAPVVEAVAQEVQPFGIEFTLVEPGPTRTNFGAGLVSPPAMAVYDATPAGDVRRAVASGAFPILGDVNKMAQAIIDCADRSPAPRRLTLGASAYASIRAALTDRIAALDAQKDIALSADAED